MTTRRRSIIAFGWLASLLLGGLTAAQSITTGTLAVPGEIDEYRFVLDRPTTLHFDAQSMLDPLRWSLAGPMGPIVTDRPFSSGESAINSLLRLGPGEHRIQVQATGDTTGTYRFQLTPLTSGAVLPLEIIQPGSLAPGNGVVFRQFTPAAGDRFRIAIAGQTNLSALSVHVVDPFGNALGSAVAGDPVEFTARVAAPHQLIVNGGVRNVGDGTYGIRLSALGNTPLYLPAPTLLLGSEQSLNPAGAFTNRYRFTLSNRTILSFNPLVAVSGDRWQLVGPAGITGEDGFTSLSRHMSAEPGDYQLSVWRNSASVNEAMRFILHDLAGAAQLPLGSTLALTNTPAGASRFLRLPLTAGQSLSMLADTSSGFTGGTPRWEVLAPDGQPLRIQSTVIGGSFFDLPRWTAPVSGDYWIALTCPSWVDSPAGFRQFRVLPVIDTDLPLNLGQQIAGSIGSFDGTVTYRFQLPTSRRLFLDTLTNSPALWSLKGPLGTVISGRLDSETASVQSVPAGEYRLVLRGAARETPAYRFRLLDIDAAPILALGNSVTNSHQPPNGVLAYRIQLNAGQRLLGRALASTGFPGERPRWTLIDPAGDTLWNQSFTDTPTVTTTATGFHVVLVRGPIDNTGPTPSHAFSLLPVVQRDEPLVFDSIIDSGIQTPGETVTYRFRVDAPIRVSLDVLRSSDVRWQLNDPSGSVAAGSFTSESRWQYDLTPGEHRLILTGPDVDTPTYRFRLLAAAAGATLTLDSPNEVHFDTARGSRYLRVALTAGQRLFVDRLSTTNFRYQPILRITDPLGNNLLQQGLADIGPFQIQTTGIHDLLLAGSVDNDDVPALARWTLHRADPVTVSHVFGNPISGQIASPGQTRRFEWVQPALRHVLVDALKSSEAAWTLQGAWGTAGPWILYNDNSRPLTLPAGPTRLTVHDPGDGTNSFDLRLVSMEDAPLGTLAVETEVQLTPASGLTVVGLELAAGQQVTFRALSRTGFDATPQWSLYDPRFSIVTVSSMGDMTYRALESGRHTLVLSGALSETGAGGTIRFIADNGGIVPPPPFLGSLVNFNQVVNGSTSASTETNHYRLRITQRTAAILDVLIDSNHRWSLRDRFGTQVNQAFLRDADTINRSDLLPQILDPGEYELAIQGGTGPYRFRWLSAEDAVVLAAGVEHTLAYTPASSTRFLAFDGTAGDLWTYVGGVTSGYIKRPYLILAAPSGRYLTSDYTDGFIDRFLLPETGRYWMLVSSGADEPAASATNRVRWIGPDSTVRDLAVEVPFVVDIGIPGGQVVYRLVLDSARELMFDTLTGVGQATVELEQSGTRLFSSPVNSVDIDGSPSTHRLQLGAGEYRITFDASGTTTPTLKMVLRDLANARPIAFNAEITGTNQPANASVYYSFPITAGDSYLLEGVERTGYSTTPYANLYLPVKDGVSLTSLNSYSRRFTASQSGLARILVSGSPSDTGTNGVHRFRLWRVQDETNRLTLGAVTSGQLQQPSQVHAWTFRLTQTRRLLLDSLTNTFVYARLTGPGGEFFNGNLRSLEDSYRQQVIVAPPGDYTLTVQTSGLDRLPYAFRLLDITEAPLIAAGVLTEATFDLPRATYVRRLQANAGETFYFDNVAYMGFASASTHRLFTHDGDLIWEIYAGADAPSIQLPTSGDYYLVVNGPEFNPATPPTYRYRFVPNPTPSPESLLGTLDLADLVPEGLTASPDPVSSGGSLTVRWITANRGTAAAPPPLADRVIVRNALGAVVATGVTTDSSAPIAPGGSRNRQWVVSLPEGTQSTGVLTVEVAVDSSGAIREANASGSGEANNLASIAVLGTLAPAPDLRPLGLSAPGFVWAPGNDIILQWQTTNAGNRIANGPWSERLVVSNANRRTVILDVTLPHPANLSAGTATARSHRFQLPSGANGYGTFVVGLAVDSANSIAEFNVADDAERNNELSFQKATALDIAVVEVEIPAEVEVGTPFPVIHTLTNSGAIVASASWLDALVFAAPDQSESVLAQRSFSANLAPGASQRVTNMLTLPVNFPHLAGQIAVVIDSAEVLAETNESNNRALSANALIPATLTFQWSSARIREDALNPVVRGTLTRNGPVNAPLSVSLSNPDPSELTVPASVVIPAGQSSVSFEARVVADGQNDGPQSVTVRASAPGFRAADATITVIDADLTRLTLTLSTNQVIEGSSLVGTLARSPVSAAPMVVQLVASDTAQISTPGAVTIPPGIASVTFDLTAREDDLIERTNLYTLTASAPGVPSVATSVAVIDNDVPTVTLVLAQRTVSEGAGANATYATLTRSPVTSRPVAVSIESGNTAAVHVAANATIPANLASITFPVGTLDNSVADGPRPVAIGGFILDSVNRAPVREIVPDVLTVTDDDGPTLTLRIAADAVGEGLTPATTATVLRNTPTQLPLLVTLTSSDVTEATVPASVTIPAGSDRVVFPVNSSTDGITDGNQSVLLNASAPGFVGGVATLVVSDADRPDLVVGALLFPTTAIGGESIPVTIRIENRGATAAIGTIVQRLSLSSDAFAGGDTLVGQITYPGPVPAGGAFEQTLNVRLPDAPGAYHFVAETDTAGSVNEILESNNLRVSPNPVRVEPAYTATVATDIDTAVAGTSIPLRGRALRGNGAPAPLVAVTIHISVRGILRTLPVVSGPDGSFTAIFQPLPTEGGLYRIAAGHPGVAMPSAQDEFRLLGFAVVPLPRVTVAEGGTSLAETTVENRTDIPLTGLTAEVVVSHPSLQVTASLSTNRLAGNDSLQLRLQVSTVDTSAIESNVRIRIRSAEGVEGFLDTRVRQEIRVPRLVATPGSLNLAMVRGRQTPVAFNVRNEGGIDTGPLRIDVPPTPWLSLSSPALLSSLPPGSNATITLLLTPAADLPLGDYSSAIALNSDRAVLGVPAQFRAISDGIGDLEVTAEDEYTYFAEGNPPLANAEIILRDALSGMPVRTNRTGLDGRARFTQLNEAYYLVSATADRHRPFQQTALVVAGATTNVLAFLSRETIRYSFFVEPTTVEDSYSLRVESVFETQVPVPVVTIEPAAIDISQYPGEEFQIEVTVRNHGLIAADSVRIQIPGGARFTATPLVNDLGRLPGGASVKVPILIRRPLPPSGRRGAGLADDDEFDDASCSLAAQALWNFLCGPGTLGQTSPFTIFQARNAPTDRFGCDDAELYTRVFEYREIPYWTQPGADPAVAAFVNSLPPVPFNYAAMTTFWRMCRPAPDLGALGAGRRPAATALDPVPTRDVCAKVSLQLDQSAVLTRDAFRATLEIENDTETPLESILVNLEIRQPNGTNVTELFGLRAGERVAFSAVDGTGILDASTTGRATWILVPTLDAAPTNGPALFLVSGTLSYRQGGTNISIPLASAPITVYPQPELLVRYFHERDVFSDDPFTPEIEPSIPYSLALQVLNVGYGNARGLRIQGGRPQIVDNQKGLQVEFRTLATQIEDQPLSPSLDIDLGAIPAGTNRIARWLFSSSIQGSFTNFAASFEHTDALGGRRLSLLRGVEIHELTRIVQAGPPDGDGRPDMLVNGTPDADTLPDQLYRSSGSVEPVAALTQSAITPTGIPGEFQMAIAPTPGWVYLRAQAPADAGSLLRVIRPDGSDVPPSNVWLTDRFIRGGALRPIRTNLFHLFEGSPGGNYRLVFGEAVNQTVDTTPPESRVNALADSLPADFPVTWSGTDNGGSGIAYYDVLSSVDGGPFSPWLLRTTAGSALFRGQPGRRYAFHSLATDQAGNREAAPTAADAQTTTSSSGNQAPVFTGSLSASVDELSTLDGSLTATDPDAGQRVSFEVIHGAPAGFVLVPGTGRYLWNPSEADGPGVWNIEVRASDNGSPASSSTNTLRVTVREVNQAPSLVRPSDEILNRGSLLSLSLLGSDPDRPTQTLRYSLVRGPLGASVNAANGLFLWRPRIDQGGRTHEVTVRVTDNGTPPLSADATFEVGVRDSTAALLLSAGNSALRNGESSNLPFALNAPSTLTELGFQIDLPTDRIHSLVIASLASDVSSATFIPLVDGRSQLRLQFRPGTSLLSSRPLLSLGFSTAPATNSVLVRVTPADLVARTEAGVMSDPLIARPGRIVLLGEEPILVMEASADPASTDGELTVYGVPGFRYALEGRATYTNDGPWSRVADGGILAGDYSETWSLPTGTGDAFYRARALDPR